MKEVYCDYCGRRAEFVDSKVIYGKSYGMIYLCRCCPGYAYVGVHKGTDLGTSTCTAPWGGWLIWSCGN